MYYILQFLTRGLGIFFILFAVFLSTELGEEILVDDLGLPISNAAIRVVLGISGDVPSAADISPEDNVQPLFGIFDIRSFLFVTCLIVGFIALSYELVQITFVLREVIFYSPSRIRTQMVNLSQKLKQMSDGYYARGASSLGEAKRSSMPRVWPVLLENIELKIPFDDILNVMGNEAGLVRKQYDLQIKALSVLANVAPSIGVIGTVLGLIKLLYNLADPSQLGPSMALALLTTLYGLFLSVVIFRPLAVRLENIKNMQMDSFQIAAFWMALLDEGKPSYYLEQKYLKK